MWPWTTIGYLLHNQNLKLLLSKLFLLTIWHWQTIVSAVYNLRAVKIEFNLVSKVVNEKAYSDQWVCDLNVKMSKIITTAEVKKHNTKDSVWMIIHNDVYDVTNYLDEVSK